MSVHPLPSDGRADAAAAIEQLFRENHRVLVRFACQYVDSREAAEEVVQELFLHLWDRRERDAHVVLSRPYLFTAVRHRALNLLRHDRVRARRDDRVRRDIPDEVPSALDVALRRVDRLAREQARDEAHRRQSTRDVTDEP